MERHTVSTQDPAASLMSIACTNYQLLEIISHVILCGMQDLVHPIH